MSNRAIRRAAERQALKAAKREQKEQAQAQTMAAAAGACVSPNVDFAEEDNNDQPKRPVSDAQYAANRANAQKSQGPVTAEGRAKSCLNAVKTGLTGVTVLLPSEDVQAYQGHVQQHIVDYQPCTAQEYNIVQRIADAEWRINRIASLEASIYAIGGRKLADLYPDEKDPAVRESLIKGEIFIAYRRDLNNLALQERRLRNHLNADIAQLQELQKARKEKKTEKVDTQDRMYRAIRMLIQSQELNVPFDPTQFGFEFSTLEIVHCYQAIQAAEAHNQPIPFVANLLADLRGTNKEAQAA